MQQFLLKAIFLFSLGGALISCHNSQVLYDYNTKARFGEYETFSWLRRAGDGPMLMPPVNEFLQNTISQVLESKGLQRRESGGDLLVTYFIGDKAPIYPGRYDYTYWPGRWAYGGYYGGVEQYIYGKGTLIIDLIDRRTDELVWRGSAPKVIRNTNTEKLQEKLEEAVALMLANFPPQQENGSAWRGL